MSELDWASKSYQEQMDAVEDYADKQKASDLLEKLEKTVLAKIATKYEGSEACKERQARCDKEYIDHITAQVEARCAALKAKGRWEAVKSLSSMRQTQESLKKAEMNLRQLMNNLDLFAGIGGFSLGFERAGAKTIAFCEQEKYAKKAMY